MRASPQEGVGVVSPTWGHLASRRAGGQGVRVRVRGV